MHGSVSACFGLTLMAMPGHKGLSLRSTLCCIEAIEAWAEFSFEPPTRPLLGPISKCMHRVRSHVMVQMHECGGLGLDALGQVYRNAYTILLVQ